MNYKIKTLLIIAGLFVISIQVKAQKFGFVNSQELITQLPEVKEANSNIETLKGQLQKLGQDKIVALQNKYKDLERKQANGEISPKQLETEATKLREEEANIAKFEQESQQKIYVKSEELLKPIQEKINAAIQAVAAENGYTYIFDSSLGLILYADPTSDVSVQVKAKLGI